MMWNLGIGGRGYKDSAAALLGDGPVGGIDPARAARAATAENAAVNGVTVDARVADATADALEPADVTVANISLEGVNALRPSSHVLLTSGYLASDRPSLAGYRRVRRLEADGWAADVQVRESQ